MTELVGENGGTEAGRERDAAIVARAGRGLRLGRIAAASVTVKAAAGMIEDSPP